MKPAVKTFWLTRGGAALIPVGLVLNPCLVEGVRAASRVANNPRVASRGELACFEMSNLDRTK
jgi:hypothetical protein